MVWKGKARIVGPRSNETFVHSVASKPYYLDFSPVQECTPSQQPWEKKVHVRIDQRNFPKILSFGQQRNEEKNGILNNRHCPAKF